MYSNTNTNTNSTSYPNNSMSSNLNPTNTSNLGTSGLTSNNPSSFENNMSSGLGNNNSALGESHMGGSSLGDSALGHSTFGGSSDSTAFGGSSLGSSGHSTLGSSALGGSTGHSALGSSGHSTLGNSSLGGSSLHTSNPALGTTSIPGNTTTGHNMPTGYSGTDTGLLPSTHTYTGTTDNPNAYNAGSSSIASNQGLTSNQTGLNSNTGIHHHAGSTVGAAATGAALGAAASHHDKHNHPHHHEHTGHHAHGEHGIHNNSGLTGTDTTGRSGMTGNFDPSTQTGNPTATGGALHKAGIGHDPSVNTTGPSTVGTAATAGAVGTGAGALAAHHHKKHDKHGHHQGVVHDSAFAPTGHHGVHHGVGTAIPGQGTGLASGFAVTNAGAGLINPATGAPDYEAVQHATIHDNAAIPVAGAGLAGAGLAGAGVGAAASKMHTASGLPKRVLMVVTSSTLQMPDGKNSGYHWSEVYHPYEIFKKHGYDVDITSLTGKAEPDYHSVNWMEQLTGGELGAMNAWRSKSHPLHSSLANPKTPTQLKGNDYGIIYFTGGHATMEDFPTAEAYQRLAAEIYERNGVVCAVCHGVAALGNVRLSNGSQLLNGKQATGFSEEGEKHMKVLDFLHKKNFPLISDHVSRAGGIYQAPNKPFEEFVVDSDRVITGPNPASAGPVADRAIRILEGR